MCKLGFVEDITPFHSKSDTGGLLSAEQFRKSWSFSIMEIVFTIWTYSPDIFRKLNATFSGGTEKKTKAF
jgi:hypothetical protein